MNLSGTPVRRGRWQLYASAALFGRAHSSGLEDRAALPAKARTVARRAIAWPAVLLAVLAASPASHAAPFFAPRNAAVFDAPLGCDVAVPEAGSLPCPRRGAPATPGIVPVQFGAGEPDTLAYGTLADPVRVRLWDETFRPGSVKLTSKALADLEKIIAALAAGRSRVELIYTGSERNATLVLGRIRFVEELVTALWRARGDGRRLRISKQWRMDG